MMGAQVTEDILDRLFDTYLYVYGAKADNTALFLGNQIGSILVDHGRIDPFWEPTDVDWDEYDRRHPADAIGTGA